MSVITSQNCFLHSLVHNGGTINLFELKTEEKSLREFQLLIYNRAQTMPKLGVLVSDYLLYFEFITDAQITN